MEVGRPDLRVLVVDDDWDFLAFIRGTFSLETSVTVEVVQTPLEAIWLLERDPFDAVICDLHLGNSDGTHLLEIVRERWPRAARVLVTGYGNDIDSGGAVPAAHAVLLKPIDSAALRDLLLLLRRGLGSTPA